MKKMLSVQDSQPPATPSPFSAPARMADYRNTPGCLHPTVERFLVLGTGFTKADSTTRSRFAVTREQADRFYRLAHEAGLPNFLILSTCNRTEFYAVGAAGVLQDFVASQLDLSADELARYFYTYRGHRAVGHFFRVTSGLESQILGDYEIVCQVKAAIDQARSHGCVGTLLDRVANFALQAARKVKTQTNLGQGKYSVSYAVAELLQHRRSTWPVRHILLAGTGSFGATVARNLRHYFPEARLALANRTQAKAEVLGRELNAEVLPFGSITDKLSGFDAVVSTAGQDSLLIRAAHVAAGRPVVLLDLCVPQTIDPQVRLVPGVSLYSVDEVSAFHNDLLAKRQQEVPLAENIVKEFTGRLLQWHRVYAHQALISSYKTKLQHLWHHRPAGVCGTTAHAIDETFEQFIREMKREGYAGCRMIDAVNRLVPVNT